MPFSAPPSWRVPLLVVTTTLLVFAALITGLTLQLRQNLRGGVLQREADLMQAVALMTLRNAPSLSELGVEDPTNDLFAGVLESSRLRGVLSVQLYDAAGQLRASMPLALESSAANLWWREQIKIGKPLARYAAHESLDDLAFIADESPAAKHVRAPLLEVAVPLLGNASAQGPLAVAHYWISGESVAAEFSRMDRSLALQAGIVLLCGSAAVTLIILWSFRRLQFANQRLQARGAELARTNQELVFVAKTAALGTISAHLIHEIKNRLLGIESFVRIEAAKPGADSESETLKEATETTRRLRELINHVVTILQDHKYGIDDYALTAQEIGEVVQRRLRAIGTATASTIQIQIPEDLQLSARTGNLAALVLVNLVGNALEAAPRKTVQLSAKRAESLVEFEVTDLGPGLPQLVQDALFQPVASRKSTGSGIGLAISFQLAQQAGGSLELVRTGSSGTTFRLSVPLAET